MSLPKFDPRASRISPDVRAYRACCAYREANSGTLGTIGTGAGTNSSDRLCGWLTLLETARMRARERGLLASADGGLIVAAIDVCRGPWAKSPLGLGWQESEIFARSADRGQIGGMIQQLNGGRIRFATAHLVYIESGPGARVYVRGHSGLDALPRIYDLPFDEGTG